MPRGKPSKDPRPGSKYGVPIDWRPHDPLPTPAMEAYAICYLETLDYAEAHKAAGYRTNMSQVAKDGIRRNPHIQARIKYLQRKKLDGVEFDKARIMSEVNAVAYSDISDFIDIQNGTVLVRDFSEIPAHLLRCISEVTESVTRHGRTVKVKLHDKLTALRMAGSHGAMWTENIAISEKGRTLEDLTDTDLVEVARGDKAGTAALKKLMKDRKSQKEM